MHQASAAHERPDEAHHKINGVIRWQNTEVTPSRPEGIPRGQSLALLQVILVREHASLGPPTRARGINDAGGILALPWNKPRIALEAKFFPAVCARKVSAQRRLSDQNQGLEILEIRGLHHRVPEVVLSDQKPRLAVRQ